jgi:hypothetical protein
MLKPVVNGYWVASRGDPGSLRNMGNYFWDDKAEVAAKLLLD